MAKSVLAELVTKMTIESSQFKKELEKTSARTAAWSKAQQKAANDAMFAHAKMGKAFDNSSKAAKRFSNGALTQVGYQVQDFAVQVSGGTNALAAFGQQGSQLAGVLGPGGAVLGAFIAIGSALGVAFMPQVFKSENAVSDLTETMGLLNSVAGSSITGIGAFTDEIRELAKVSEEATKARIDAAIINAQRAASLAAVAIRDEIEESLDLDGFFADLEGAVASAKTFGDRAGANLVTGVGRGEANAVADKIGESFGLAGEEARQLGVEVVNLIANLDHPVIGGENAFRALEERLSTLSQSAGSSRDEMLLLIGRLAEFFDKGTEASKAAEGLKTKLDELGKGKPLEEVTASLSESQEYVIKLAQELAVAELMLQGNTIEATKLSAAFQLGKNSIEELPEAAQRLLERLEEVNQKQAEINRQAQERASSASFIDSLDAKFATEIEVLEAQNDERLARIASLTLSEEDIKARGFDSLLSLQQHYAEMSNELFNDQYDQILQRNAAEIQAEMDKQDAIAKAKELRVQQEKSIAAQGFLSDLQAATAHSKKLAGLHKAAAIAQATVNTYNAANQALAAPFPWPVPQIFAGVAIASGLANIAAIKSTPIAGARELGGPVTAGRTYLVGEKGPELFTANATGQITSNSNLNKAMSAPSGNVLHFNPTFNGLTDVEAVMDALSKGRKRFARMVNQVQNIPA